MYYRSRMVVKEPYGEIIMKIEEDLNDAGKRLKRARILAGISTRREFQTKHNISANTLQGWEQGKNPLSEKGARRVVEAFKEEGLICSVEWLLSGNGMPPRPYEMLNTGLEEAASHDTNLATQNLQEEEAIYQETQVFKRHNQNAIVISVIDDAMDPYISVGDYVGGIRIRGDEINAFLENLCIVELEDHNIIARFLHAGANPGTYTLSCTNPKTTVSMPNYHNVRIISAAPVVWHRRKLATMRGQD